MYGCSHLESVTGCLQLRTLLASVVERKRRGESNFLGVSIETPSIGSLAAMAMFFGAASVVISFLEPLLSD